MCVVEWPSFKIDGWAAYIGAVNLRTGEPAQMDEPTRKQIDSLAFQGHNAYSGDTDKHLVRSILAEIEVGLSAEFICSAAMAAGVGRTGYRSLRKLVGEDRES